MPKNNYSLVAPIDKNEDNIADLLTTLQRLYYDLDQDLGALFIVNGSRAHPISL